MLPVRCWRSARLRPGPYVVSRGGGRLEGAERYWPSPKFEWTAGGLSDKARNADYLDS